MSKRYERQLILPQIGEKGQEKLKSAKVLIIGAGGLGSPVSIYLTAAGVGTVGLVDGDIVELNNLQRQIVHSTETIGLSKVDSAANKLNNLNPDVKIIKHKVRLDSDNAENIIRDFDIIVDACDNFATRYVINDTCVKLNKPFSHGAIFQFEGQLTTIIPGVSPCYRCVFPEPNNIDDLPLPSNFGVLGVVPGVIGLLQATEVLKYIVGKGELLVGKLLIFDALKSRFRNVSFNKKINCPVCGRGKSI